MTAFLLVFSIAGQAASRSASPLDPITELVPDGLLPPAPLASTGGLWLLAFQDEFDGPGLDGAKWSNGFGWGDTAGHVAGACDPANNIVEGGVLIQRADQRPLAGRSYSAACINTKNKFFQLYGYWEARIRVPRGRGLHSAFWAKPNDESWPPELDVEEISGGIPDRVTMTVHWRDEGGHRQSNAKFFGPDFSADYHVFGAEWSPGATIWFVDGVERGRTGDGAGYMDDRGPFYLIVNLQVGLVGAGLPDPSTPWPAQQYVDYVRVWDRPLGLR
ncbi:MAG TPA: glycoside hydrolase family 16 protein [Acidimicrobiia bacterium]